MLSLAWLPASMLRAKGLSGLLPAIVVCRCDGSLLLFRASSRCMARGGCQPRRDQRHRLLPVYLHGLLCSCSAPALLVNEKSFLPSFRLRDTCSPRAGEETQMAFRRAAQCSAARSRDGFRMRCEAAGQQRRAGTSAATSRETSSLTVQRRISASA